MKRIYYKKPIETFEVDTEIIPKTPKNLLYILPDSSLSLSLDLYRGTPSDVPQIAAFEFILKDVNYFFEKPDDLQVQLIHKNRPIAFQTRDVFKDNVYLKTFAMEKIGVEEGPQRLIFVSAQNNYQLNQVVFQLQYARFDKIVLSTSSKIRMGKKINVQKVKNEAEIYGISRFRGGVIKFNRGFTVDILSPNLDRIVGQATFFARKFQIDESVDPYCMHKVMPWSPDPRMTLVSGRLREAQVQTYDFVDADGAIVEL
ncbi:hypothetical protein SS50377_21004 [Spironucleus salmonicida]|uniref:Uncharacterized protein n=1 Tax=Spironucleus salmonicida TaxID=348837 RepID=V6LJ19_9EUKA|nr:hypothetical protein SS50377_21004 [Spironucleus salmonicida]|eukprot:EST43671.1 Hypothetical protein SS50377_16715 [Spironucleus salmonicida]